MADSSPLHPLILGASSGELPSWASAGPRRRAHMSRVAELMGSWARALDLDEVDEARWRAAGFLHDVLRDEDPAVLRRAAPPSFAQLSGPLLHGPVAAEGLREEGVADEELLLAVAYHTIGHPGMDLLGLGLFTADFVEPGRSDESGWRAARRRRMPHDRDRVFREVAAARLVSTVESGRVLREESVGLWNRLVGMEVDREGDESPEEERAGGQGEHPNVRTDGPGPQGSS